MSTRRQIGKAFQLSNEWMRVERADPQRVGIIVQNQSTNLGNFLVSEGRPTSDFAAIEIAPSANLYEDILPMQGEIWAKGVLGATPVLSLTLKY